MYKQYTSLSSLTDFSIFKFLYLEAVDLTASSYGFRPKVAERNIRNSYNRFIKLFLPLTKYDYTDDKVVTLAVALCVQSAAAFPIVANDGAVNDDNLRSHFYGLAVNYANELVALSFGVMIFSVESSRILRAQGYYSSNYVEFEFIGISTLRTAMKTISDNKVKQHSKVNYTQNFRQLMRLLKKVLDYKISSGRIIKKSSF